MWGLRVRVGSRSTLLTSTEQAAATPARKLFCLSKVNSALDSGSDTSICTYLVLGLGFGVGSLGFRV